MLRFNFGLALLAILFWFDVVPVSGQVLQSQAYDYCDPKLKLCDVAEDHTMCKFPSPELSSRCQPALHEPLSATEKKRILFWHNKFRSNVANGSERNKNRKLPTSSNMRQLYWDKELEAISARWAEQCTSTTNANINDNCRNTKRFNVSQNVGTRSVNSTTIDKQAPQLVIAWYKESKDFDPAFIDKFQPASETKTASKQFTNIIWADTYAIGCARALFQEELPLADKEQKKSSIWSVERLVCNYGPAGNEAGKPVYKRGTPCENCPEGTECSVVFPGLCAIKKFAKLEGQQSLENQESKDDVKSELGQKSKNENQKEKDSTSSLESSPEQTREEMENEMNRILRGPSTYSNPEDGSDANTSCSGDDCWRDSDDEDSDKSSNGTATTDITPNRIEEIMNSPKSSAGLGFEGPETKESNVKSGGNKPFIYYKKQKRSVSNGKRLVREVLQWKPAVADEKEKQCKCFEVIVSHAETSLNSKTKFYLFTAFIYFAYCNY